VARLPSQPERAEIEEAEVDAYDRVVSRFGSGAAGGYFGALLNSPAVCDAINSTSLVFHAADARGTFSRRQREWADVVVATELNSRWMLNAHFSAAVAEGIEPASIRAVWEGRGDALEPEDVALVAFVRGVVSGTLDDASFAWLERSLGTRGAVEYTAFVCWVAMNTRLIQALGVPEISDDDLQRTISEQPRKEDGLR
jgi:hypothetical protein